MSESLLQIILNSSGALAVTALFVWYMIRRDKEATRFNDQQMKYLQSRDAQSKEIAASGHAALERITDQLSKTREEVIKISHRINCDKRNAG